MLTIPIPFFQASNSGHTWFLCRRHRALEPHFVKVLSAFLRIIVQKFGNNKCWPFQFHSSELLIPAKSGFCTEGIQHCSFALRRLCQHFFTSLSKILATINVDPSKFILPTFKFWPKSDFSIFSGNIIKLYRGKIEMFSGINLVGNGKKFLISPPDVWLISRESWF